MVSLEASLFSSEQSTYPDENYVKASVLGKGAYGTVYKGRDRNNPGSFVAIKEIRIPLNTDDGIPMNALREIGLLKQLDKFNHPNIVRLYDVCPGSRTHRDMKLNLIFEHIDQDLSQFLERCPSPGLGPDMIKHIFHEILSGVDFIHTHRIIHRDLKPQNILIDASGQKVKLADFGLARVYGYQMALTSVVVTLYYRAPEVLLQDHYRLPIDLWSCGCIFAELHTRKPLFRGTSEQEQLSKIFECVGLPSENDWPENLPMPRASFRASQPQPIEKFVPDLYEDSKDLIEGLLKFDQASRITAHAALQHVYFDDYRSIAHTKLHQKLIQNIASSAASTKPQQPSDGANQIIGVSENGNDLRVKTVKDEANSSSSSETFTRIDQRMEILSEIGDPNYACHETLEDDEIMAGHDYHGGRWNNIQGRDAIRRHSEDGSRRARVDRERNVSSEDDLN